MQYTTFIGIDVSKETLDVCVISDNKVVLEEKIKNNQKSLIAIKKLTKPLGINQSEVLWCLEHTGIYCNPILYALHEVNASIWLENPLQIKLSQGLTRGKNDKVDAKRIAVYAQTFSSKAKLWVPKSKALLNLKQLVRMRDQLLEAKHGISVAIKEAKRFLPKGNILTHGEKHSSIAKKH
ncbi:MAG: transposase [Bacteroidia bacterium]|nr:transposase [Bacteroidia bacterium]